MRKRLLTVLLRLVIGVTSQCASLSRVLHLSAAFGDVANVASSAFKTADNTTYTAQQITRVVAWSSDRGVHGVQLWYSEGFPTADYGHTGGQDPDTVEGSLTVAAGESITYISVRATSSQLWEMRLSTDRGQNLRVGTSSGTSSAVSIAPGSTLIGMQGTADGAIIRKVQFVFRSSTPGETVAFGGFGGRSFDRSSYSYDANLHVTAVVVRSGDSLDGVRLGYTGSLYAPHRGGMGGRSQTMTLRATETISQITVQYASYYEHITFRTSHDRVLSGGATEPNMKEYTVLTPPGSEFVGFAGREGALIDRLQMFFRCVEPTHYATTPFTEQLTAAATSRPTATVQHSSMPVWTWIMSALLLVVITAEVALLVWLYPSTIVASVVSTSSTVAITLSTPPEAGAII